ncbi:MAG: hypothetical protein M9887_09525 [Chitinophagales bacterium]|nr:hypothetical protein [Chitinophagales bacterium]
MMKVLLFTIQIFCIALITWLVSLFSPWWIFALVCFVMGMIFNKVSYFSFLGGFTGTALFYFFVSFHQAQIDNFEFANKIAKLMGDSLNISLSGYNLLYIGLLLFGILGGLFCLSGTLLLSASNTNKLSNRRGRINKFKGLKLDLK